MNIAFFCIPAHGHTNPTLAVVRELTARGHTVRYYTTEAFRTKVETAGAVFVPIDAEAARPGMTAADGARLGSDLTFSTKLIVDLTLAADDWLSRELTVHRPDVIVGDSMAFWAKLAAKKHGIPFVSSTTTFAFNRFSAKVIGQNGAGFLQFLLAQPRINRQLKRLRAAGYAVAGPEIISCPTCGRTQYPMIEIANEVEARLRDEGFKKPLKIAIMGCVVNGPGEASDADIGIAGGKDEALLFIRGEKIRMLKGDIVGQLLEEIHKM